jgi:hypothetical protein
MLTVNGVTAVAPRWIGFSEDDVLLAEGANIRRQSRICFQRVEDNAFHLFYRLSAFGFHDFAALGDQKIARFLAKQRNCSRFAVRSARVARRATPTSCGLITRRIKLLLRQFRRRDYSVPIAFPENSSEASAIGPTKVRHKIVDLWIGNFCRNTIHS